jgi:cytidylate kinase
MAFIIAIDGPTASGKGTLAASLAKHFGYPHMDTGLLYRQVAKRALDANDNPGDAEAIRHANNLVREFRPDQPEDPALRSEAVSRAASQSAAVPDVRTALFDLQRGFAATPPNGAKGAVLDGRDIGTVICPDAHVKLFVTASAEVRAQRRVNQLQSAGIGGTYDAVLQDLRARDERDLKRDIAPTVPAKDAIVLDTSTLDREEVLKEAIRIVETAYAAFQDRQDKTGS